MFLKKGAKAVVDYRVLLKKGAKAVLCCRVLLNKGKKAVLRCRVLLNKGKKAVLRCRVFLNKGKKAILCCRALLNKGCLFLFGFGLKHERQSLVVLSIGRVKNEGSGANGHDSSIVNADTILILQNDASEESARQAGEVAKRID